LCLGYRFQVRSLRRSPYSVISYSRDAHYRVCTPVTSEMTTYYFALASQKFLLEEEPLEEVLKERTRDYQEKNKEIDFWLVKQPAFLESAEFAQVKAKCPQPAAAIISTNEQFITWLKLRLEYVYIGEFEAPSATISNPLASLETVS
jgi:Protein of unknown function (DUF2488)